MIGCYRHPLASPCIFLVIQIRVTIRAMKVHLSARVDAELADYLADYQQAHGVKTRSEALEIAIRTLRDKALEHEYAMAMEEWEQDGDAALWDRLVADGLEVDVSG